MKSWWASVGDTIRTAVPSITSTRKSPRSSSSRSKDGGNTWSIETPQPPGVLIGTVGMRHGLLPKGASEERPIDLDAPINFAHPDLALTLRMEKKDKGVSRFFFSYDRGKTWRGPFRLPLFGQKGVMARTDYVVDGQAECSLFLTASKADGREGRPFCAGRPTEA